MRARACRCAGAYGNARRLVVEKAASWHQIFLLLGGTKKNKVRISGFTDRRGRAGKTQTTVEDHDATSRQNNAT